MRVLMIGVPSNNVKATSDRLLSDIHQHEFETIVWDPQSFLGELENFLRKSLSEIRGSSDLQTVERLTEISHKNLMSFVERGSDLIVIARNLQRVYDDYGSNIDLNEKTVLRFADPIRGRGSHIEYCGPEALKHAFTELEGQLNYCTLLKSKELRPLFRAKGTTDMVGGFKLTEGGGCILFLPYPEYWEDKQDGIDRRGARTTFLEAALTFPQLLKTESETALELPPWTAPYLLPRENDASQEILSINEQIKGLLGERAHLEHQLLELRRRKLLFAGDGDGLEEQVEWALTTLGFDVHKSTKPNRVDRIAIRKDCPIVVEIKGRRKSATEGDATQLDKWVSEYFSEHHQEPKGLLVVNAYRDTPPESRTDLPFPDQIMAYCKKRQFCLVTGLQLLNMALTAATDATKKDGLADLLFTTVGPVEGHDAWDQHMRRSAENDIV